MHGVREESAENCAESCAVVVLDTARDVGDELVVGHQLEHHHRADRAVEALPQVAHQEVGARHLDREEHASDRRPERRDDADGARGGEHRPLERVVLVEGVRKQRQLHHKDREDGGEVHHRPLAPNHVLRRERRRQPDHLGAEHPRRQVARQPVPGEDRFHLRDPRPHRVARAVPPPQRRLRRRRRRREVGRSARVGRPALLWRRPRRRLRLDRRGERDRGEDAAKREVRGQAERTERVAGEVELQHVGDGDGGELGEAVAERADEADDEVDEQREQRREDTDHREEEPFEQPLRPREEPKETR